jgi:hypothetical protein
MSEDDESVHSGTSVPSIGEDAQDPQVRHLIVSEECCRAVYRSSDGGTYICPRITEDCMKRNHVRLRVTNRGDPAIYEIHRGVRGGFRGVFADVRLSPDEHNRLIQEARDRNRASAALTAGADVLTGASGTVADVSPTHPTAPTAVVPAPTSNIPMDQQTPEQLLATIAALQVLLQSHSASGNVDTIEATSALQPVVATHSIPPAITVPTPMLALGGASQPPSSQILTPATPPLPPTTQGAPLIVTTPTLAGVAPTPAPPGNAMPATALGILHPSTTPHTPQVSFAASTGSAAPISSMGTPSADRWYAVVVGRSPSDTGVYKDYANVAPLVVGVSGAVFRGGFKTKVEADSYLASVVSIPVTTTPTRKQKWYVITVGGDPSDRGIYDNWPDVAQRVLGVGGAVYQGGFQSLPEAERFLNQAGPTAAHQSGPAPSLAPHTPQGIPPQQPPHYPGPVASPQQPQATPTHYGGVPQPGPGQPHYPVQNQYQTPPPPSSHPSPYPPHSSQGTHGPGTWSAGSQQQGYWAPSHFGTAPHQGTSYGSYPSQGGTGSNGIPSPSHFPHSPGYGTPSSQGMNHGPPPGTPHGGYTTGVPGNSYGATPPGPGFGAPQGTPVTPGGAYGGTHTTPGTTGGPWTMPQRLVGADPSSGTKGDLWGVKANEDLSMLNAWSPPGMQLEKSVRFGDQALDAVGLPASSKRNGLPWVTSAQ